MAKVSWIEKSLHCHSHLSHTNTQHCSYSANLPGRPCGAAHHAVRAMGSDAEMWAPRRTDGRSGRRVSALPGLQRPPPESLGPD